MTAPALVQPERVCSGSLPRAGAIFIGGWPEGPPPAAPKTLAISQARVVARTPNHFTGCKANDHASGGGEGKGGTSTKGQPCGDSRIGCTTLNGITGTPCGRERQR